MRVIWLFQSKYPKENQNCGELARAICSGRPTEFAPSRAASSPELDMMNARLILPNPDRPRRVIKSVISVESSFLNSCLTVSKLFWTRIQTVMMLATQNSQTVQSQNPRYRIHN